MENINDYDSFLNEYYRGKNSYAGFNYKDAEITLDVEFLACVQDDMSEEYFEDIIDKYFNKIFDKHTKMVDTATSSDKKQINNIIGKELNLKFENVYEINVKFDGYSDAEAYSMLDALHKKMVDEYDIIILPQKLNGKDIKKPVYAPSAKKMIGFNRTEKPTKELKVKNKIGFRK